jgi:predicted TIM-barrel fold metal-dependent hydrolase
MRPQLLDASATEWALLDFGVGQEAGLADPEFALAVVRAMNDWNIDRWLEGKNDPRLCGVCLVPLHLPEQGAAEIRRVGSHPKIVGAYLAHNSLGQPFGHPIYHPVYEAAAELELPLYLHVGGNEYWGAVMPWLAGGRHAGSFDFYASFHQSAATHLTSLLVQGVLEKYPGLNVMIAESGLGWFPWLASSLDAHYERLREESVWVKRWPSEYLRERVALTTQPIEATPQDGALLIEHLSSFEGIENILCFSSDYPHFDGDVPSYLESILPSAWHERVFHENARRHLRLPALTAPPRRDPMYA